MLSVRLTFEKRGEAKYLSHLDLMRCFTRAVRRCGYDVWYTEGFNPHIYLMFACPLSLGFESGCETVDLRLVSQEEIPADLAERINRRLPQGVRVTGCALPQQKHTAIAFSGWNASIPCEDAEEAGRKLAAFLDQGEILAAKKSTKAPAKTEDIKPLIRSIRWKAEQGTLNIEMVLSQHSERALNPMTLFSAFSAFSGVDTEAVQVVRTGLFDADMKNFC